MRYAIYSFRYPDRMTFECYRGTHERACKEIDRLASLENGRCQKSWLSRISDPLHYTFMPVGGS